MAPCASPSPSTSSGPGAGPGTVRRDAQADAVDDLFTRILEEGPGDTLHAAADDGARLRDFFQADARDRSGPSPRTAGGKDGWPANNYGPAYWSVHEERKRRGLRRPTELRRGVRGDAELWDVEELAEHETPAPPPPAAGTDDAVALPWRRAVTPATGSGPDAWLDGLDDRLDDHAAAATEARLVGLLHDGPVARTQTLVESAETLYARPAGLPQGVRLVEGRTGVMHARPPEVPMRARARPVLRRLAVVTPAAAAVGTFLGMLIAALL